MAWTSPMTWVAGSVLTAAQLNTHLRDNIMETMPAKATQASQYFVTSAQNRIIARLAVKNTVLNAETSASSDYGDLATVGPSVTVTLGTSAVLFLGCQISMSGSSQTGYASVAVAAANTIGDGSVQDNSSNNGDNASNTLEASDSYSVVNNGNNTDSLCTSLHMSFLDTFTPGDYTFTMKYRAVGGTVTFQRRRISVMPLD